MFIFSKKKGNKIANKKNKENNFSFGDRQEFTLLLRIPSMMKKSRFMYFWIEKFLLVFWYF